MYREAHNVGYIRARNKLIPQAERWADAHILPKNYENHDEYYIDWNKCYFKKMNDLAKKAGISWIK